MHRDWGSNLRRAPAVIAAVAMSAMGVHALAAEQPAKSEKAEKAVKAEVVPASRKTEVKNMRLVGSHDLQGRSAYQPVIHHQGKRWIAYVGHASSQ